MLKIVNKLLIWVLPLILVGWCAILLSQKIDLSTADLGRHIKNGEIILHAPWAEKWQLLHHNFYSYTQADFPFVNHHWLSGAVFYLTYQGFGFKGLSVFYIATVTAAFYLFFRLAQKRAGSAVAACLAVLVLPLIASRAEVRPEGLTYLLSAVFFWLLWRWRQGEINSKRLFLLPALMLLWVNLHIGFIFGFLILGAFWLWSFIRYWFTKKSGNLYFLSFLGFLSVAAASINPFFVKGFLFPLKIFENYGYLVVENQSVRFLERLGMGSGLYFGLFKVLLIIAFLSFILRFLKQREWKIFPYQEFLLLGSVGALSFFAIRNFPVFGLLFLPIVSGNIKALLPKMQHPAYKILPSVIAVIIVVFGSFRFWGNYKFKQANFGIGLMPNVNQAAEFFKQEKIQGPVFNNYDIGGYLIFHLFNPDFVDKSARYNTTPDKQMIFTDNRPEAYSVAFFREAYVPAQGDDAKWQELDEEYNFNAIFFSHRDLTPWGQNFLISRVKDSAWAPVFVDEYNIIFVKKNSQNLEVMKKYLLPPETFRIVPDQ